MGTTVTLEDADGLADLVLREARYDGVEQPHVATVAARLGSPVFAGPPSSGRLWREKAVRARVGAEHRIYVRADVREPEWAHLVAHELGHDAIARWGLRVEGCVERWCNRFGSAVIAPSAAVRAAWRRSRELPRLLSTWSHAPQTAIALRLPEAARVPVWIFEGARLRYGLGDVEPSNDVRRIARAARHAKATLDEGALRAVPLVDGIGRVAVVAA